MIKLVPICEIGGGGSARLAEFTVDKWFVLGRYIKVRVNMELKSMYLIFLHLSHTNRYILSSVLGIYSCDVQSIIIENINIFTFIYYIISYINYYTKT